MLALATGDGGDSGQTGKRLLVGGDDLPVGGTSSRRDQQIVGAAGPTLLAHGNEELGVLGGHGAIVGQHR
jgi:hypothetical protein